MLLLETLFLKQHAIFRGNGKLMLFCHLGRLAYIKGCVTEDPMLWVYIISYYDMFKAHDI
ncbi:hypothetical protein CXB41_21955 [Pseudomonas syringae pv. syringae]|nr:hypothetical protein CXB41_21955 [Pseudomonas syringae pv. syringae]